MTTDSRLPGEPARRQRTRFLSFTAHRARVLITASMLVFAVGAGMGLERFVVDGTAIGSQQHEELEDLESFETLVETYNLIREEYVLSGEITDEELIYGASVGMMDALGDEGHSMFLTPEEAQNVIDSRSGNLVGIGISVDDEVSPPTVVVPLQDSPALEAGIMPGDQILAIDGVSTLDFENPAEAVDLIVGEEGTDVTIELRHLGEEESYEVTITRAKLPTDTVSWVMLPDNVMWLRISRFEEGTGKDVERALRRANRMEAEGVILDLRHNPGGLIIEELAVAGQFLPEGTVVFQDQDADGNVQEVTTTVEDGEWQEGPLAVLINEESVSAAEVTAAALAENDRAVTYGVTTFGTGTTIMSYSLEDGSMVRVGVSMWLTPDGNVIWHEGLDPMVEVENDPTVPLSLPYTFDDEELTEDDLAELEDDQLLAGYDGIQEQIDEAAGE